MEEVENIEEVITESEIESTTEVKPKKAKTTKTKTEEMEVEKQRVNFNYPKECIIKRGAQAYLSSTKYSSYRDILTATLEEDKQYTEGEVVEFIENYLNGGVK